MKTEWDYSSLADAYLQRPDYSAAAIDAILKVTRVEPGNAVCDVGAGVAHLSRMLAERDLVVTSVEPNDAMRANGLKRTSSLPNVEWFEGTGENTGRLLSLSIW
jgi:16S rRNA A1518/A1519 N6-dimethyltransferase RsmA/KsgA/DIM1 with predicted DNA glycosylase/AP lyase activity